jgi:hypothetical protein
MPDLVDESSDDTDSSYESTDSSTESDSEDYYYHEEPPAGGRHERRRGGGATLVYSADSLKHIRRPHLKFGDDDALDTFRVAYVKYVKERNKEMRKRPYEHRVDPYAVVECIDPYLLTYICVHALEPEDQTEIPENVSAVAVHDWVMKKKVGVLGAEDNDGLAKLKNLKIVVDGTAGVRNVQGMIIEIDKIKEKHQLQTKDKKIID